MHLNTITPVSKLPCAFLVLFPIALPIYPLIRHSLHQEQAPVSLPPVPLSKPNTAITNNLQWLKELALSTRCLMQSSNIKMCPTGEKREGRGCIKWRGFIDQQKSMKQKWTIFLSLIFTAHCMLTAIAVAFHSLCSSQGGRVTTWECSQHLARHPPSAGLS